MVSTATIVTNIISFFVSALLPPLLILLFVRKHRGQKLLPAWLLGAAGFFVTQILIRVPILLVLQTKDWFMDFAQTHMFLYAFLMAFTAGLFELAGRFAVAKLMKKDLTFNRSLAAGLGHGGIEAMVLVGGSCISNFVFIVMINSGTFDTLIAEAVATGAADQIIALGNSLIDTHPALFLLAGFERILAMTAHVGMTMIVCYALYRKKPLQGTLLCLAIHTMIDLSAGISMLIGTKLTQSTAYIIIYTILTVTAAASVWIVCRIRKDWTEKEDSQ